MTDTKELDPLIAEMIKRLPESGAEWSEDSRTNWLLAARGVFGLVYKNTPA